MTQQRRRPLRFPTALALTILFLTMPRPARAVGIVDGLLALNAVVEGTETFERAQATLAAGTRGPAGGPTVNVVGFIDDGSTNVLRRGFQFTTSAMATPVVRVTGAGRSFIVPPTGYLGAIPNQIHTGGIFGLRANTDYTLTVSAYDAAGRSGPEVTTEFTTGPLPASFPPIQVPTNEIAKRTPGYILFDISSRGRSRGSISVPRARTTARSTQFSS